MPKRCRGATDIVPSSIILISCVDDRSSVVSVGPKMPVGLSTTSSVSPPAPFIRSHAARSAIAFERGYGARPGVSGSVQSSSVYSAPGLREYPTAAKDDVSTTRRALASRAARSTRSAPSRAGTISSSGSSGWAIGIGDATW